MQDATAPSHELDSANAEGYVNKVNREKELLAAASGGKKSRKKHSTKAVAVGGHNGIPKAYREIPIAEQPETFQQPVPVITSHEAVLSPQMIQPVQIAPATQVTPVIPSNAIVIDDQKIPVEIIYAPQGSTGAFTVGIIAKSAEVNEDGISILIDNKVTIKPPALVPLKIVVNNTPYTVVFAGGMHSFGPLKNISFVRASVEQNGEASSSTRG